jgi:DNA-directed RNA polymerase specialized sigma24 family protein
MQKWYEVRPVTFGPLEDVTGIDEELDFPLFDLDMEMVIFTIKDRKEIEILVFKMLGFKYNEVAPLIGTSISEYYIILRSLKRHLREQLNKDR